MKRTWIALFGLLLFWAIGLTVVLSAAAPTLSSQVQSTCTDTAASETTGTLSWTNGDFIVAQGVTEDNSRTLTTPTTGGSGITLAAVTGTPTDTANTTKNYAWTATASATSSGTFTSSIGGGDSAACLVVWAFTGSDGLGNTAINASTGTTTTISLVRGSANSFVTWMAGDWNAVSDTATDVTPTGNQRVGDNLGFVSAKYNSYANDYGDQGAAGTTSYGISAHAGGGEFNQIALEIKGTGAAPAAPKRLLTLGVGE